MLETMLSAIAVFAATSIDFLIILILLFSQAKQGQTKHIWTGQFAGTALILIVSLLTALGVMTFVPESWQIGLLGLIPIFLGIRFWIIGEDEDEEEVLEAFSAHKHRFLWVTVTLIVLAASADNFSIYIPYFTTLRAGEIYMVFALFAVLVALLCYISARLAAVPAFAEKIEKHQRWIVPLVFIALGLYILVENGTFSALFAFLAR